MRYEIDLIHDVVLLLDENRQILDAFEVIGKTEHEGSLSAMFYTLRSLVFLPGYCCLCGKTLEQIQEPCVSSGGYHAFVGMEAESWLDPHHKAENRSVQIFRLFFEDLSFYVTDDNLFPIEQIAQGMVV